jgi:hypothetical protein
MICTRNIFANQKYTQVGILVVALIYASSTASAQSIVLLPNAAGKGAALQSDPSYKSAAEEIITALKKGGFKVAQSESIQPQYLPKRKRPSTKDWRLVFQRNGVNFEFLISLIVTRHIQRSPINQSEIGIKAMLFEKNNGVRPIALVSVSPKTTSTTLHPRCFGPCLTEHYARQAKEPARLIGKKLVKALRKAATRSSRPRPNRAN